MTEKGLKTSLPLGPGLLAVCSRREFWELGLNDLLWLLLLVF